MSATAPLEQFMSAVQPAGRATSPHSWLAPLWADIKSLRERKYAWSQIADYVESRTGQRPRDNELSSYFSRRTRRGKQSPTT
jgi:hypothetical protein